IRMADCIAMYKLFIQYYDNTSLETFIRDMSKKTGVLVIYSKRDDSIVGFSTITNFQMKVDGQAVRCVFSGDTVVDRRYWGTSALRISGLLYLWRQKVLHPFTPVYWYLISMGYRTYLMMANNFPNYYPHVDGDDPHMRNIAMAASEHLFPGTLDRERGMLDFGEDACRLKGDVTPISDAERSDRKIAFFEKRNPHWMRGDEMPCLGAIDLGMIWHMLKHAPSRIFHWDYKKRAAQRAAQRRPQHAMDGAQVSKR
ncbi:MAG TPA: hypothetical protein VFH49_17350, partial [Aquabacterium sp.]|nr:hypothetical protein [Aquabacterium sp.]